MFELSRTIQVQLYLPKYTIRTPLHIGFGMCHQCWMTLPQIYHRSEGDIPLALFQIAYKIADRRAGDVATCYADPTLAEEELGWKTQRTLDEMCK